METLCLNIAGLSVRLDISENRWASYFKKKFRNFISDKCLPTLRIRINFHNVNNAVHKVEYTLSYQDRVNSEITIRGRRPSFETINFLIKHIFSASLLRSGGAMIHASAVAIKGKAYIFVGESSSGKSTIKRLIRFGKKILADDRALIRKDGGQVLSFCSPFYEHYAFIKRPVAFKVQSIYLLEKKIVREVHVARLSAHEAFSRLIPHVVIRHELPMSYLSPYYVSALRVCELLVRSVPIYTFSFPMDTKKIRKFFSTRGDDH